MEERKSLAELRLAVASNAPSGANLEYDTRFQDLARMAEGSREQQYGSTVIAAKPPEWKAMQPLVDALLTETRDLRLGVIMVESAAHFEGFIGCAEALDVLRGWVSDLWDTVHPQLDPEDDLDPFIRVNALSRLNEEGRLPKQLMTLPLAECPPHSRVTLADIEAVRTATDKQVPAGRGLTAAEIEATFLGADLQRLRATFDACQSAYSSVSSISQYLEERAGEPLWDAALLRRRLRECGEVLKHHLRVRLNAADSALAQVSTTGTTGRKANRDERWSVGFDEETAVQETLEVVSREHAGDVLQSVIAYFEANEPSSPVPLLLRRAKRLINQGFVDILRDVAPDGLGQVRSLAGGLDDS